MKVSNGTETYEVDAHRLNEAMQDGFVPTIRVSNGTDTFDAHPNDLKLAEADGFVPVQEKASKSESAARGFAQGASLGFADEAVGGAEALWEKAKGNPAEFGNLYEQYRNESRAAYDKAEKDNPGYYSAGEIGGGLATAALPLGSTATVGRAMLAGAGMGALNSVGQSRADDAKGVIVDGGIGLVLGAAGGGIAKGAEKGLSLAKKVPALLRNKGLQEAAQTGAQVASMETGAMPINNPSAFRDAAQSAKNRLKSYWNPEVDPKFKDFQEIAKKNGIDPNILPESVKFGPDSSAARASRSLAEGRFGEESLKKFNDALDQVRGAYDKKIQNYAKGVPVDEVTAGKVLRDSYDEGVSKFFDQMDFTHNSIIDQAPGLTLTPDALSKIDSTINGVEKFAKGRLMRGVTDTQKKQGQQLLNAVEAIRAGNGSYKQTVEALRDIGEAAFQSKNVLADVPVDAAKMRKIYNDLNESLIDTVRSQLGDDIANSLVENNKAMSEFFGDKSLVARVMGDKAIAPENAFRSLVLNGDSQKIQALKKIIPPEKWEYLKGAVLENLAKRDAENNFTFKQLYNSMRSKRSALNAAFDPQELIENAGLVRLGDRFGSPVLSSSGTGASLSFQDLYKVPANVSVDALAIRNANKAAEKAAQGTSTKSVRDVTPRVKEIPAKVGGAILGSIGAKNDPNISQEKTKGPDKWASDGFNKLLEHSGDQNLKDSKQKMLSDPKTKDLLIKASDLKPGSKAMDEIMSKIKNRVSKGQE